MTNYEIAAVLEQLGRILEIKGDDPFKLRAYYRAAESVGRCSFPIRPETPVEDLTALPGVGKAIAAKVIEIAGTGTCALREELLADFPRGLLDILRISGIGPKRAALLHRELGIVDIASLEQAAHDGRIAALPKMGKKVEENILRGIELLRSFQGRILLSDAMAIADAVISLLPAASRPIAAGSLRRGRETIGDIDILTIAEASCDPTAAFVSMPDVSEVLGQGDTRSSVVLKRGVQVDLRVVEPESYGAALQYFTGSQQHNIRLREHAIGIGLKVNEYGVFRDDGRIAGATEEEVYAALGLPWIPPEIREDGGELPAAMRGELPRLVELSDIRGDLQMHSQWSDGAHTIRDMALAAQERGYEYIAITDHTRSLAVANGLTEERLLAQIEEIRSANGDVSGITVLTSTEVEILQDGALDLSDEVLGELDLVLASVHSGLGGSRAEMTRRVIRAVANPRVRIIAHPTGRTIGYRDEMDLDLDAVIDACVATNTALEINSGPMRLDLRDAYARRAVERGARVCINTDAHAAEQLAWIGLGLLTARRGWVEPRHVINALTLAELREWLRTC